jgi:uncharacterized protein
MKGGIDLRPKDFTIVQDILSGVLPINETRVFAFGSRVSGLAKRGSDLDLALDLGRPLTRAERHSLADQFEACDLPYTVDVIDLQTISPSFKAIVQEQMRAFSVEGLLLRETIEALA